MGWVGSGLQMARDKKKNPRDQMYNVADPGLEPGTLSKNHTIVSSLLTAHSVIVLSIALSPLASARYLIDRGN
jgi:hypothetical protein